MRAAKSIGVVHRVCEQFEMETAKVKSRVDHHTVPSTKKEVKLIVDSLLESPGVLTTSPRSII